VHEILLSPEFESIYLVPLSDLHIGDQYFNEKLFNKWVRWILGEPNIFVLFTGDIFNVATKGSVSDTYGELMNTDEALDYGVKLLSPLKERIWDVTEGNHDARVYKEVGLRLSKQLALRLDVHYSGIETYLKVKLGKNTAYNGKQITYILYATHGWGA
jgi:DNA polymerase II small subunit/DNA polymerase delta subunit B